MYFPSSPKTVHPTISTNKRLFAAILFSLLAHAFILSLQFGLPGLGVPSIKMPWNERRAAPLQIKLAQAVVGKSSKIATTPTTQVLTGKEEKILNVKLSQDKKNIAHIDQEISVQHQEKKKIDQITGITTGITILAPINKMASTAFDSKSIVQLKKVRPEKEKRQTFPSHSLPQLKSPTQLITQDQLLNNDFIVPLTEPEDLDIPIRLNNERLQKVEAIPAESIVNQETRNRIDQLTFNLKEEMKKQGEKEVLIEEQAVQEQQAKEAERIEKLHTAQKIEQEMLRREIEKQTEDQMLQTQLQYQQDKEIAQIREEEKRRIEIEQEQKKVEQQKQQEQIQALQIKKEMDAQEEKLKVIAMLERQKNEKLIAKQLLEKQLEERKITEQNLVKNQIKEKASNELAPTPLQTKEKLSDTASNQQTQQNVQQHAQASLVLNEKKDQPLSGLSTGELTSRLREQARTGDLLKSSSSLNKLTEEKNNARKRSFLGAYDKEIPLRMYIDSVKGKLERNGNLIYAKRSIGNDELTLLVNMIIRSDGSLEDVSILRSSGSHVMDEKVKNIIIANAPYAKFPPNVAAKYDVIEVQKVWNLGDHLRIYDEAR